MYRIFTLFFKRKLKFLLTIIFFSTGIFYIDEIVEFNGDAVATPNREQYLEYTYKTKGMHTVKEKADSWSHHRHLTDTDDIRPAIHKRLTEMKFGPVNVFGVAAANTSHDLIWDIFKIYAYINISKYDNATYYCCLKYSHNTDSIYRTRTLSTFFYASSRKQLGVYHFVCPNIKHGSGVVPLGVTITVTGASCSENDVVYLEPSYPLKMPGKLLIGLKVAFHSLSPEIIIEWMEASKYLGVDKVVGYYVSSLNEKARRVLNYYAFTGFLDLFMFHPPWEDIYPRDYRKKNRLSWNDEQLIVYDTVEKYSGYEYVGFIDYDEFLIPTRNRTLKQMIEDLMERPGTVGLVFKSQQFFTSWGPSGAFNDMILGTHVNRTASAPEFDRRKNIFKPSYINMGHCSTHVVRPIKDFKIRKVQAEDGFLRHFRSCRPDFGSELDYDCDNRSLRVTDTSAAEWSNIILKNVQHARKQIFGTEQPIQ